MRDDAQMKDFVGVFSQPGGPAAYRFEFSADNSELARAHAGKLAGDNGIEVLSVKQERHRGVDVWPFSA